MCQVQKLAGSSAPRVRLISSQKGTVRNFRARVRARSSEGEPQVAPTGALGFSESCFVLLPNNHLFTIKEALLVFQEQAASLF